MASVDSSTGFVNLPAQSCTAANQTLLVPAAGLYQGLPSPVFSAGSGLFVALDPDYQSSNPLATSPTYTNSSVDGKQFRVRIVGLTTAATSSTFQVSLYNGTSSTTTADTLIAITPSYTITTASTINWVFETDLLWDSTSSKLNGWFWSDVNNVVPSFAAITSVTSLSVTSLAFIPSFSFGTTGSHTVTVKEILVSHV